MKNFFKNPYKNPLYYWWKVRKIFKKPPLHVHIGKYTYILLCDWIKSPKIQLAFNGLGWKDKYDSPRYEYFPNILFKFFNWEIRIFWSWQYQCDEGIIMDSQYVSDDAYWETILDMVVYNKTLNEAMDRNTWQNNINVKTMGMLK